MAKENKISIEQDLNEERLLKLSITNLNKNVTILRHNVRLKCRSNKSFQVWIYRLELLFDELNVSDKEKINIALQTIDDELFYTLIKKKMTSFEELKTFLLNEKEINEENFQVNEWVRIYEDNNSLYDKEKYEMGIVTKICENGLYEVACKGKALKIHGSNMVKI